MATSHYGGGMNKMLVYHERFTPYLKYQEDIIMYLGDDLSEPARGDGGCLYFLASGTF